MKHLISLILVLLSCMCWLQSCMQDDAYTLAPTDVLTFSKDTIDFDTIISGSPTNTYGLTVYNHASKAIRIRSIQLDKGAASPFKVNADGIPLTEAGTLDWEIAAKDSLKVLLMANMPSTDSDEPTIAADFLTFTTEAGVSQKVVLKAAGQAVNTLVGARINTPTLWQSKRPYRIMDSLVVEAGQTLTLSPGTRLWLHPNAEIIVHGTLQALGTLDSPIEIRGDRMGYMFAGQAYDRIPGQWGGITFRRGTKDNYLNYVNIHSGTYGIKVDSTDINVPTLVMENSVIHNVTHDALNLRMANIYVGNSQITNAGGNCVTVRGGDVTMVHTTIARFFVFTGGEGVALNFANYDGATRLPITRLQIANSIITGYQSDEIMGNQNKEQEADAFNYAFFNCLLNTPLTKEENTRLVNCWWDLEKDGKEHAAEDSIVTRDGNFLPLPDLKSLEFSFQLSPHSKAVGNADAAITATTYPQDRLGRSREGRSDMGCYQLVGPTKSNRSAIVK